MFPNDLHLSVAREQHQDRLHRANQARLVQAVSGCPVQPGLFQVMAGWLGQRLTHRGPMEPGIPARPARCPQPVPTTDLCPGC